jgi:hypothetical protein
MSTVCASACIFKGLMHHLLWRKAHPALHMPVHMPPKLLCKLLLHAATCDRQMPMVQLYSEHIIAGSARKGAQQGCQASSMAPCC